MLSPNVRLTEVCKPVPGFTGTPSTTAGTYFSMKGASRATVFINVTNGSTVTGSAITLTQATAVANTGGKTLGFTRMLANTDTGAGDTLTETTVSSNTFTTGTTNSKRLLYVLDIKATDLDVDGGFDCVRVNHGDGANTTLSVLVLLHPAKYGKTNPIAAITD